MKMKIYTEEGIQDQPFNNSGLLLSFRFWLISIIAGKSGVVMNVNIKIQDRKDALISVEIEDMDRFLLTGIELSIPDSTELVFSRNQKQDA